MLNSYLLFRTGGTTLSKLCGRLKKIRVIYNAMRILFYKIPKKILLLDIEYSLLSLFHTLYGWFRPGFSIQRNNRTKPTQPLKLSPQKRRCTTIILILVQILLQLERSLETFQYQNTWTAHLIITSYESSTYKIWGFRKDNKFVNRLVKRARHSKDDWLRFAANHWPQDEVFKKSTFKPFCL